jgi:hypothetical protein
MLCDENRTTRITSSQFLGDRWFGEANCNEPILINLLHHFT